MCERRTPSVAFPPDGDKPSPLSRGSTAPKRALDRCLWPVPLTGPSPLGYVESGLAWADRTDWTELRPSVPAHVALDDEAVRSLEQDGLVVVERGVVALPCRGRGTR